MNYEILVDMSIDIDLNVLKANDVKFVPMEYMIGEESHKCFAPESDEMMHEYYDKLRNKVPTQTSQISPYHYLEVFEPLVKEGKEILYISLSSGLSKTYESALMAVKMLSEKYDNVNIEVVDSLGATGGMGLLTETACASRAAGMSLSNNAEMLRVQVTKTSYWFKVEDLMYLMRGGRVSATTAVVGTALNIKPILTIDPNGKLETVAKKRGDRQALSYMIEQFEKNFDPSAGNSVYISCADCKDIANTLKSALLEKHPDLDVHITMLSPIIGAHTGPDMVSLIYYSTGRVI